MTRTIQTCAVTYYFTADTRSAWLWLIARVWLGYEWFMAGWEKFQNPVWWGNDAGTTDKGGKAS